MIKKIICYIFGHNETITPVKVCIFEGASKLIIHKNETCIRCYKKIERKLFDYEIPFFIRGKAIFGEKE